MSTFYTEEHEWVIIEDDIATIGITDHAQDQLGDIVFVDLPDIEDEVSAGDDTCVVESVKAAGDIHSPISGTIIEVNESLTDEPGLVNSSPEGDGWIYKLKVHDTKELENLMNEEQYRAFLA